MASAPRQRLLGCLGGQEVHHQHTGPATPASLPAAALGECRVCAEDQAVSDRVAGEQGQGIRTAPAGLQQPPGRLRSIRFQSATPAGLLILLNNSDGTFGPPHTLNKAVPGSPAGTHSPRTHPAPPSTTQRPAPQAASAQGQRHWLSQSHLQQTEGRGCRMLEHK